MLRRTHKVAEDYAVIGLSASLVVFFASAGAAVAAGADPPTELWAAGSAVSGALIGLLVPGPRRAVASASAASEAAGQRVHGGAVRAAEPVAEQQPQARQPAAEEALEDVKAVGDVIATAPQLAERRGLTPREAAVFGASMAARLHGAELAEAEQDLQARRAKLNALQQGQPDQNALADAQRSVQDAAAKVAVHEAAADTAGGAVGAATDSGITAAASAKADTKGTLPVWLVFFVFVATLALGVILSAGVIHPHHGFGDPLKQASTTVLALAAASGGALVGLLAQTPSQRSVAK